MNEQSLVCDICTWERLPKPTACQFQEVKGGNFGGCYATPTNLLSVLKDPEAVFGVGTAPFIKKFSFDNALNRMPACECVTSLSECPVAKFIADNKMNCLLYFEKCGYDFLHSDGNLRYYFHYEFNLDHDDISKYYREMLKIYNACKMRQSPVFTRLKSKQNAL